jgi:hypothetical protein
MFSALLNNALLWFVSDVRVFSFASKVLMAYGALMWLACAVTYFISLNDVRTIREVGIWIKPMKFMAATALFAWSTVWLTHLANASISHGEAYKGICALLVATSLFEVLYITYQASLGEASHYNNTDALHAFCLQRDGHCGGWLDGFSSVACMGDLESAGQYCFFSDGLGGCHRIGADIFTFDRQRWLTGRDPTAIWARAPDGGLASL